MIKAGIAQHSLFLKKMKKDGYQQTMADIFGTIVFQAERCNGIRRNLVGLLGERGYWLEHQSCV